MDSNSNPKKKFQKSPSRYKGGEGTLNLSRQREEEGFFGFVNAYWCLTLFSLHGRAMPIFPALLHAVYTVIVVSGCILVMGLDSGTVEDLGSARDLTTIVGLAVFLLISFRNQAAYMRWWDGAKSYNDYLWINLGIAMQVVSMYGELYPKESVELIWWILASVEASKAHLRRSEDYEALIPILPASQLTEFLNSKDKVLFAWYKFNKLVVTLKHASTNEIVKVHPVAIRSYAYCVNISNTPFPFVYLSHMRTFMYIWLATVPWVFVGHFQWWTILVSILVGFGVLGVEEAAVEVEQPFGTDYNDLPLDHMTRDVYESLINMAEMIKGDHNNLSSERCAKMLERCATHLNSFDRRASGMLYFKKPSFSRTFSFSQRDETAHNGMNNNDPV